MMETGRLEERGLRKRKFVAAAGIVSSGINKKPKFLQYPIVTLKDCKHMLTSDNNSPLNICKLENTKLESPVSRVTRSTTAVRPGIHTNTLICTDPAAGENVTSKGSKPEIQPKSSSASPAVGNISVNTTSLNNTTIRNSSSKTLIAAVTKENNLKPVECPTVSAPTKLLESACQEVGAQHKELGLKGNKSRTYSADQSQSESVASSNSKKSSCPTAAQKAHAKVPLFSVLPQPTSVCNAMKQYGSKIRKVYELQVPAQFKTKQGNYYTIMPKGKNSGAGAFDMKDNAIDAPFALKAERDGVKLRLSWRYTDLDIDGFVITESRDGKAWSDCRTVGKSARKVSFAYFLDQKKKDWHIGIRSYIESKFSPRATFHLAKLSHPDTKTNDLLKCLTIKQFPTQSCSTYYTYDKIAMKTSKVVDDDCGKPKAFKNVSQSVNTPCAFYNVLCSPVNCSPLPNSGNKKGTQNVHYEFLIDQTLSSILLASREHVFDSDRFKVIVRMCEMKDTATPQEDKIPDCIISVNTKIVLVQMNNKHKGSLDITDKCSFRKYTASLNTLSIEWMPNNMSYCITVSVVEMLDTEGVVSNLMLRNIRSASVTDKMIKDILKPDSGSDISYTSLKTQLICPLGKTRLITPCRGSHCTHVYCIDALTLLKLNETRPLSQKKCFMCDQPLEYMYVDGLFLNILRSVPEMVNEVLFEKDGYWSTAESVNNDKDGNKSVFCEDSDHNSPLKNKNDNAGFHTLKDSREESESFLTTQLEKVKLQLDRLSHLNTTPMNDGSGNEVTADDHVDLTNDSMNEDMIDLTEGSYSVMSKDDKSGILGGIIELPDVVPTTDRNKQATDGSKDGDPASGKGSKRSISPGKDDESVELFYLDMSEKNKLKDNRVPVENPDPEKEQKDIELVAVSLKRQKLQNPESNTSKYFYKQRVEMEISRLLQKTKTCDDEITCGKGANVIEASQNEKTGEKGTRFKKYKINGQRNVKMAEGTEKIKASRENADMDKSNAKKPKTRHSTQVKQTCKYDAETDVGEVISEKSVYEKGVNKVVSEQRSNEMDVRKDTCSEICKNEHKNSRKVKVNKLNAETNEQKNRGNNKKLKTIILKQNKQKCNDTVVSEDVEGCENIVITGNETFVDKETSGEETNKKDDNKNKLCKGKEILKTTDRRNKMEAEISEKKSETVISKNLEIDESESSISKTRKKKGKITNKNAQSNTNVMGKEKDDIESLVNVFEREQVLQPSSEQVGNNVEGNEDNSTNEEKKKSSGKKSKTIILNQDKQKCNDTVVSEDVEGCENIVITGNETFVDKETSGEGTYTKDDNKNKLCKGKEVLKTVYRRNKEAAEVSEKCETVISNKLEIDKSETSVNNTRKKKGKNTNKNAQSNTIANIPVKDSGIGKEKDDIESLDDGLVAKSKEVKETTSSLANLEKIGEDKCKQSQQRSGSLEKISNPEIEVNVFEREQILQPCTQQLGNNAEGNICMVTEPLPKSKETASIFIKSECEVDQLTNSGKAAMLEVGGTLCSNIIETPTDDYTPGLTSMNSEVSEADICDKEEVCGNNNVSNDDSDSSSPLVMHLSHISDNQSSIPHNTGVRTPISYNKDKYKTKKQLSSEKKSKTLQRIVPLVIDCNETEERLPLPARRKYQGHKFSNFGKEVKRKSESTYVPCIVDCGASAVVVESNASIASTSKSGNKKVSSATDLRSTESHTYSFERASDHCISTISTKDENFHTNINAVTRSSDSLTHESLSENAARSSAIVYSGAAEKDVGKPCNGVTGTLPENTATSVSCDTNIAVDINNVQTDNISESALPDKTVDSVILKQVPGNTKTKTQMDKTERSLLAARLRVTPSDPTRSVQENTSASDNALRKSEVMQGRNEVVHDTSDIHIDNLSESEVATLKMRSRQRTFKLDLHTHLSEVTLHNRVVPAEQPYTSRKPHFAPATKRQMKLLESGLIWTDSKCKKKKTGPSYEFYTSPGRALLSPKLQQVFNSNLPPLPAAKVSEQRNSRQSSIDSVNSDNFENKTDTSSQGQCIAVSPDIADTADCKEDIRLLYDMQLSSKKHAPCNKPCASNQLVDEDVMPIDIKTEHVKEEQSVDDNIVTARKSPRKQTAKNIERYKEILEAVKPGRRNTSNAKDME